MLLFHTGEFLGVGSQGFKGLFYASMVTHTSQFLYRRLERHPEEVYAMVCSFLLARDTLLEGSSGRVDDIRELEGKPRNIWINQFSKLISRCYDLLYGTSGSR